MELGTKTFFILLLVPLTIFNFWLIKTGLSLWYGDDNDRLMFMYGALIAVPLGFATIVTNIFLIPVILSPDRKGSIGEIHADHKTVNLGGMGKGIVLKILDEVLDRVF